MALGRRARPRRTRPVGRTCKNDRVTAHSEFTIQKLVIIGGGPGGYEAALVAASLGADVTIVEQQGLGGSAVLTDVVPSKTLIASADAMTRFAEAADLGVHVRGSEGSNDLNDLSVDLDKVNTRLLRLAATQSRDIKRGLERVGVRVIAGTGRLLSPTSVQVTTDDGLEYTLDAQAVLLAVGSYPRELPSAKPDGERIFNWKQLYHLREVPEHMIVVGSGVTGAEFASAYRGLGAEVTLVSSRDQVLPGEDQDAAAVLENVFERRGMNVLNRSRADAVERSEKGVVVTLSDGRKVAGSHCLVAVGAIPATDDLGLEEYVAAIAVSLSVLAGDATVDEALQTWGPDGLQVMLSGQLPPNPSEMLGSLAAEELFVVLSNRFDTVIVDCPPLLPVTDAAIIARYFEGAIMVAGSGKVQVREFRRSLQMLDSAGVPLLGVIANRTSAEAETKYQRVYAASAPHPEADEVKPTAADRGRKRDSRERSDADARL